MLEVTEIYNEIKGNTRISQVFEIKSGY